jgi:hypothetical protein
VDQFVRAWHDKFQGEAKIAGELYFVAMGTLEGVLDSPTEGGRRRQLGRFLASHRDRVEGGFRIVSESADKSGRAKYRLVPVGAAGSRRLKALQDAGTAADDLDLSA